MAVNELAFSADGSRLISAGSDATVRLWNPASGALVGTINVGSIVYAAAISPHNKLVASGSFDGLTRVWDEAKGTLLLTLLVLPGQKTEHDWLALTPAGYAAGNAGMTGFARWRLAGRDLPAPKVWQALGQPGQIARSLRGENIAPPKFSK